MVLQIVVALGLLNVWLMRTGKATPFRGGEAKSMKEEFEVYGLPGWMMVLVGVLKVSVAIALLVGIWLPVLVEPAAWLLALLMAGALLMHIKVKDSVQKSVPALLMLCMAVGIAVL